MKESNESSLPPLPPSPAASPGGGAANKKPKRDTFVESIRRRLEQVHTNNDKNEEGTMFPIPRVPQRLPKVLHRLRKGNNDAYEPNIISIGPYHRGNPRLQAMEKKKLQHLNSILSLNSPVSLEGFIEKLRSQVGAVWRCYPEKPKLSKENFLEMMLLDSCFIIHHLLQLTKYGKNINHDLTWIAPLVSYDLLLLENQLPFFLLQFVYGIIYPPEHSPPVKSLVSLAYNFYRHVTHNKIYEDEENNIYPDIPNEGAFLHLLQLCHFFFHFTTVFSGETQSKEDRVEEGPV
eukprot:TRINITY_DN15241_c0_g1_i2.p1 TRINITY_DN15241_c0_g1~~TRINITY_DN15241_c0_g1_i2.p1  ORF type:complete len:290 (-),score=28.13 TRINITY_DN15241_c0_g1_i2:121-990(-)